MGGFYWFWLGEIAPASTFPRVVWGSIHIDAEWEGTASYRCERAGWPRKCNLFWRDQILQPEQGTLGFGRLCLCFRTATNYNQPGFVHRGSGLLVRMIERHLTPFISWTGGLQCDLFLGRSEIRNSDLPRIWLHHLWCLRRGHFCSQNRSTRLLWLLCFGWPFSLILLEKRGAKQGKTAKFLWILDFVKISFVLSTPGGHGPTGAMCKFKVVKEAILTSKIKKWCHNDHIEIYWMIICGWLVCFGSKHWGQRCCRQRYRPFRSGRQADANDEAAPRSRSLQMSFDVFSVCFFCLGF